MSDELKQLAQAQQSLERAEEINTAEAIIQSQHDQSSLDMGILLGRIQMSQAFEKIHGVVSLSAMKEIKEQKKYRELKGRTILLSDETADGRQKSIVLNGTWDEFCQLCHTSKSTIDERLKNLDIFGEKALESMQSIGMTTKDLRRLRKLPQEDVTAIVEGEQVKISDRDEALEIIEEMSAKYRLEKQSLQNQVTALRQEKQSHERLLADKDKKINQLSKRLDTPLTPVQQREQAEKQNGELLERLNVAALAVDSGLARLFDAIQTIKDTPHPIDVDDACEDALFRTLNRFLNLSAEMGIHAHVREHLEQWDLDEAGLFDDGAH